MDQDLEGKRDEACPRAPSFLTVIRKKLHVESIFNLSCAAHAWKRHGAVYATLYTFISTDSFNKTYLLTVSAQNKEGMGLWVSHRRSWALQTCMQTVIHPMPPAGAGTRALQ